MMAAGHGTPMPELARRMTLATCHLDPVRALIKVLTRMPGNGMPLGDILADSGYAHRDAAAWAIPLRQAGAQLIQDLHPSDRGPRGTHHGAIIANGNLYCPQTPTPLLQLGPAGPRRHLRRDHRARHAGRRASAAQARPDQRRRRRRLPPHAAARASRIPPAIRTPVRRRRRGRGTRSDHAPERCLLVCAERI